MSISRARSWPLLDPCAKQERENVRLEKVEQKQKATGETEEKNCHPHSGSPQVQARRLLSRHYYPEGGWGWVVTVVSTLVHLLGPGLQLSIPATLALPATVKFYHQPLDTAATTHLMEKHEKKTPLYRSLGSIEQSCPKFTTRKWFLWLCNRVANLHQVTNTTSY